MNAEEHLKTGYLLDSAASKERSSLFKIGISVTIFLMAFLLFTFSPESRVLQGNSDFLDKFTATQILQRHLGAHLYDVELQRRVQQEILASLHSQVEFPDGVLLYTHPPFAAIWYLPLVKLSYVKAFLVWSVFSLLCFGAGLTSLIRTYGLEKTDHIGWVVFLCLAFLPLLGTLLQGQNTAIGFLFLGWAFLDLKKHAEVRAGFWLSLVLVKFQILPPLLLLMVIKKRWKVLLGFMAGCFFLFLISLFILGGEGLIGYFQLLVKLSGWVNHYGVNPMKAQCMRGQIFSLFYCHHPGLVGEITFFTNLILLMVLLYCWKGKWMPQNPAFDLRFALLVITSLLVAPHINFHDLSFLLLPGLLIYQFIIKVQPVPIHRRILLITTLIVGYPILLATFVVSEVIPIHLSVIGLLTLDGLLVNQLRSIESPVIA